MSLRQSVAQVEVPAELVLVGQRLVGTVGGNHDDVHDAGPVGERGVQLVQEPLAARAVPPTIDKEHGPAVLCPADDHCAVGPGEGQVHVRHGSADIWFG